MATPPTENLGFPLDGTASLAKSSHDIGEAVPHLDRICDVLEDVADMCSHSPQPQKHLSPREEEQLVFQEGEDFTDGGTGGSAAVTLLASRADSASFLAGKEVAEDEDKKEAIETQETSETEDEEQDTIFQRVSAVISELFEFLPGQ